MSQTETITKGHYELLIRERHLDTFGHMNNATYFEILEEARWELISSNGYDLAHVQKTKQGPVVLEANIKFKKELRLRETVTIETWLGDYSSKVGTIIQVIKKESGDVAAEAEFVFGLFDLKERKLIEPTDAWKKGIGCVD